MSIELDRPGGGVAAFMLCVGTLLALEKNGTLANNELADMGVRPRHVPSAASEPSAGATAMVLVISDRTTRLAPDF